MTRWLETAPAGAFTLYAITASFLTYFCMYAFRKPFSAAKFADLQFFGSGIGLKTVLVSSQIIGYTLSKYLGIKFCSELMPQRRAMGLVGLIVWAQAALVLFGALPDAYKFVAIFLNGLSLGMVWGLVVGYLEGRRTSELLLAGLSCSFILASGVVKNVGQSLMGDYGVSEGWMPAAVGGLFLPLYLASVWMLDRIPPATREDQEARTVRETMNHVHRLAFVKHFLVGLVLLIVAYFFLTAYRDFRDNFTVEIFSELGYSYEENKTIITQAELIVAFGVMGALALLNLIKDNRLGLLGAFGIMTGGVVLMGLATLLLDRGLISGFAWMTLVGLGSYLAYVPYGSVLFDRLIASTRVVGTAVFAIYLADAIGYTGSVGMMLYKDIGLEGMSRLEFFRQFTYALSAGGAVLLAASSLYFLVFKVPRRGREM